MPGVQRIRIIYRMTLRSDWTEEMVVGEGPEEDTTHCAREEEKMKGGAASPLLVYQPGVTNEPDWVSSADQWDATGPPNVDLAF